MNPFENNSTGYYSDFIANQVSCLSVGQSKKLDIGDKKITDARVSLQYVGSKLNLKFKTKVVKQTGEMWVKRVA